MFTKFLSALIITLLVFVLPGCKSNGGVQEPITPLEVKVLAMTAMSIAINVEKINAEDLTKIETALKLSRDSLLLTLQNDPGTVGGFDLSQIEGLDPLYQDIIGDIVQIAVLRIRPYIDQEHPDLATAVEYIHATFDGALAGINRARTRLAGS